MLETVQLRSEERIRRRLERFKAWGPVGLDLRQYIEALEWVLDEESGVS